MVEGKNLSSLFTIWLLNCSKPFTEKAIFSLKTCLCTSGNYSMQIVRDKSNFILPHLLCQYLQVHFWTPHLVLLY